MNNKLKIISFIINILLGMLLFVFAGIDDSPGGQLISLLVVIIGVTGLATSRRRKS